MDRDKQRGRGGGMPGDGAGRIERPGMTGVHPASAGWPETDMQIRREAEWGQGARAAEAPEDVGLIEEMEEAGDDESGAGQPGPADEANAALDTHTRPFAGSRGPADELPPTES